MFLGTRIGIIGLGIIIFYVLLAAAHPILMNTIWEQRIYDPVVGYSFDETRATCTSKSEPSPRHRSPLDAMSLASSCSAPRSEFMLGMLAAIVTVCIGTTVGAVTAYYGGIIDTILMRLADIMIMMPGVSVLIVLSALIGVEHFELALIIGLLSGFGGTGVVLKSQALSVVVKPYIDAAKTAGGSSFHVIFVHVVPNLLPLSLLYMMFTVTNAIFSEAILSFLGLLDIRMSWGLMIPHHRVLRLPPPGRRVLVADTTREPVNHPAVLVVLLGGTVPRRSCQPQAEAVMNNPPRPRSP